MDSLTQIVLGAAVGEAVLGKKIGNRAALWGAIAGTIPDLDVMARYLTDTITATEIHRGFSHSILFAVLVAPVLGWLVHQLRKRPDVHWKEWAQLFFWGLFTHPLLDIFTTWGTQLFWPLEPRIAFNSIFVIDPVYTLPFLLCVILALRKPKGSLSRKRNNNLGLYLSTGYLIITLLLKYNAHVHVEAALKEQGVSYTAISTRPSFMNTILWNVNVDAGEHYLIGDYSIFDSTAISFNSFSKNREDSADIIEKEGVQRLIAIAQGWYIIERENQEWIFNDLRFGLIPINPSNSQFVFRYKLKELDGQIVATEDRPDPSSMQFVLKNLWTRILGN